MLDLFGFRINRNPLSDSPVTRCGLGSVSRAGGGHLARSLSRGIASAAESLPLPAPPPKPPGLSRSPQQEDPPWSIGGGGRPVDDGPRFFPYVDRGFRVGGLAEGRQVHLGKVTARGRATPLQGPCSNRRRAADPHSGKIPPGRLGAGGGRSATGRDSSPTWTAASAEAAWAMAGRII